MARDAHYVVHNPNGGWDVKRGGGQSASAHADTEAESPFPDPPVSGG